MKLFVVFLLISLSLQARVIKVLKVDIMVYINEAEYDTESQLSSQNYWLSETLQSIDAVLLYSKSNQQQYKSRQDIVKYLNDRPLKQYFKNLIVDLGTSFDNLMYQVLRKLNIENTRFIDFFDVKGLKADSFTELSTRTGMGFDQVLQVFGEIKRNNPQEQRKREDWVMLFKHLRDRFVHRAPYLLEEDFKMFKSIGISEKEEEEMLIEFINILVSKVKDLQAFMYRWI